VSEVSFKVEVTFRYFAARWLDQLARCGKSRPEGAGKKAGARPATHSRTRRRVRARIDTRVDRTRRARPVENAAEAQREGRRSEARGS